MNVTCDSFVSIFIQCGLKVLL